MITINSSDFRTNLSHYLDQLEKGEDIAIIRHSRVIGVLRGPNAAPVAKPKTKADKTPQGASDVPDTGKVTFRRFGSFEDPQGIIDLHQRAGRLSQDRDGDGMLNADLHSPSSFYDKFNGEFWVGELNGQIVATGGYRLSLRGGSDSDAKTAELRRLCVLPGLEDHGVKQTLKQLLIDRAQQNDFQAVIEQE